MKFVIAAAVAAIFGLSMIGHAEARCWWNGYATVCEHGGEGWRYHGWQNYRDRDWREHYWHERREHDWR